MKLSIVIPAYNEENALKKGALLKVYDYMKDQDYTWEVIVANDGSTDSTVNLINKFIKNKKGFRLLDEPHKGKAGIVITGMLKARGDYVLFTDMDQSTPINQIEKFWEHFENGANVVIGSRSGRKGAPLVRKIMAFGYATLRNIMLNLPFKDTQTGFKAFDKNSSDKIFKRMKKLHAGKAAKGASVTAGFDIEFLYIARKLKMKIVEVPVEWHYEPGASGKSVIKNSIDGLKGILTVRMNAIRGVYKN